MIEINGYKLLSYSNPSSAMVELPDGSRINADLTAYAGLLGFYFAKEGFGPKQELPEIKFNTREIIDPIDVIIDQNAKIIELINKIKMPTGPKPKSKK